MDLPIRAGFIHFHFALPLPRPRSLSAPPEIFVALVAKRSHEKEVRERWARLTLSVIKDEELSYTRLLRLAKTYDNTVPKLRARITFHIYKQLRHCILSGDKGAVEIFLRAGFFRTVNERVEIWCTDLLRVHPMTSALLDVASRLCDLAKRLRIEVSCCDGLHEAPYVGSLSIQKFKLVMSACFGIPPRHQVLMHLGKKLKIGTLASNGVRPGSIILLRRAP